MSWMPPVDPDLLAEHFKGFENEHDEPQTEENRDAE
jgi:hypothetical protein